MERHFTQQGAAVQTFAIKRASETFLALRHALPRGAHAGVGAAAHRGVRRAPLPQRGAPQPVALAADYGWSVNV